MTTASAATTGDSEAKRFPPGIPYIVGNEGAERFSYYGMRAILKTYLAALYLKMVVVADPNVTGEALEAATKAASSKATAVTHLFMAGVYAFPMIGALMADRLLGKYPVIFWLSLVYCAGHGLLAIAGRFEVLGNYGYAEYGFYCGLVLIAIGSGGIKPCVSANVGDQFTEKNKGLVTKVFQIFYFIINFGSFFSTLLIPFLKDEFGPEVAFGVPGIVMGVAAIVFWMGRNRFVRVQPKPGGALGLLDTLISTLFFSPVIAIIAAVFVVSDGYKAPAKEALSNAQYYSQYVSTYVSYLAEHAWPIFAISAGLVALGAALFVIRQRKQQDTGFLAMLLYAVQHRHERQPGEPFFGPVRRKFGDEAAEGPPAVFRICTVFSMISVFWALFDQHASTWITQAQRMNLDLTVPRALNVFSFWGTLALSLYGGVWLFLWISNIRVPKLVTWSVLGGIMGVGCLCGLADLFDPVWVERTLKAEQISALNPLMVMLIIPGLNVLLYNPLEKRGITIKPLQKMTVGLFLSAAAFAIAAILQAQIETAHAADGAKVHVLWQTVQYLIMTTAEVLVSVTGLEFAYTQAPRAMKSTIMGFWLLCVTFGNVLVAFLAPLETIMELSQFFWVFTGLMTAGAAIFSVLAYFYKGKTYMQGAAAH
ncbi:MAG: MFS transporter [Planctomycetota bacterium]